MFAELYSKPERLEQFMEAMSEFPRPSFKPLPKKFNRREWLESRRRWDMAWLG
jgi:hypothetical protein